MAIMASLLLKPETLELPEDDKTKSKADLWLSHAKAAHYEEVIFDPSLPDSARQLGLSDFWDGLDELTTTHTTTVVEVVGDEVTGRFEVTPEEVGLRRVTVEDISVGDPSQNAHAANAMLEGVTGPVRDMVVLNAAAGLVVTGLAENLDSGVALGARVIDDGRAAATLGKLVAVSRAITMPGTIDDD